VRGPRVVVEGIGDTIVEEREEEEEGAGTEEWNREGYFNGIPREGTQGLV